MSRLQFPNDFLWGSASSAYQIEGAYQEDHKGLSIWDIYANQDGNTYQNTNGNIACDHYHRYQEDIAYMKEMGLKSYRFSISWTRLLPHGRGEVNEVGIAFYQDLIDKLLENGIEPLVTLYHWDLPLALQEEYAGWESRKIIDDFLQFAELCFSRFEGKVKYWIVLNEPNIFTQLGYLLAMHPPKKKDLQAFLTTYHHTALVHAATVKMFKEEKYHGMIGSSIAFTPAYAASDDILDKQALENYYQVNCWWLLDSFYRGSYPERGMELYQQMGCRPPIEEGDEALLKEGAQLSDFIGINYYQSATIAHNPIDGVSLGTLNTSGVKGESKETGVPGLYKQVLNPHIAYTDWDWAIDPDGLTYGLIELKERYQLPILISENGLGAYDVLEDGKIHDDYRVSYLEQHVIACHDAIQAGVKLIGYCTWSFTDLLSWLNGYKKRYGFVYIDFEDQKLTRIKKHSFFWYQQVIAHNGATIDKEKYKTK